MSTIFPEPVFEQSTVAMFVAILEPRLEEGEELRDVIEGGFALASRRSKLFERPTWSIDGIFAFSLFCWWPGKPERVPDVRNQICGLRRMLFAGAADETSNLVETVR